MGYRSDVAYVIAFDSKQTLNEFIAKVMVLGGHVCEALKECQIEVGTDRYDPYRINFFASDVKWYDSFTDVQGHTRLRELADEWYEDKSASRFIRIGEEEGDLEEDTYGDVQTFNLYDEFYTYTRVNIPFDADYEPIGDRLGIIDNSCKV